METEQDKPQEGENVNVEKEEEEKEKEKEEKIEAAAIHDSIELEDECFVESEAAVLPPYSSDQESHEGSVCDDSDEAGKDRE